MTRRELVAQLLEDVPERVEELRIVFVGEQFPTTSFMDELIRQTLAEHRTDQLTLIDADAFTTELAQDAADRYEVADRLVVIASLS